MPRNASGTYTLPAGNPVATGTLIEAAWANTTLDDLGAEMTDSLSRSGEGGMLVSFKIADGTVALPGLAFTLEPGTGLSRLGTNEFDFSVGGSRVIQLTVNGMTVTAGLAVLVDRINENTVDAGVTVEGVKLKDSKIEFSDIVTIDSPVAGELELNATNVDLNANLDVSGTYTGGGTMTTGGNIVIPDAGTVGSVGDTSAMTVAADGDVTLSSNLTVGGTYTGGGTMTTGGSVVIPDGGSVGSTTTAGAIQIGTAGQIGINTAAAATKRMHVEDATTGNEILYLNQTNAANAQHGLHVLHAGTGNALYSQNNAGTAPSVFGYNNSASGGVAVRGHSVASYGGYFGTGLTTSGAVFAASQDGLQYGLLGHANTYGVYGTNLVTPGVLSKGSGTFCIPHPLKSEIEGEDWSLLHSFIEGPQCDLIYRGRAALVDGRATVSMDTKYGMTAGTFEWLTKADDVQTFSSNETGWDAVKSSFSGDTITIECQNTSSTDTISWMVVAERGDPNIKASTITDDDGNLIIERPSDPEVAIPQFLEPIGPQG